MAEESPKKTAKDAKAKSEEKTKESKKEPPPKPRMARGMPPLVRSS